MSEIIFKSLKNLDTMRFHIPSYQRGYRWTKTEVSALLDDLYEYAQNIKSGRGHNSKFYCLQPLVVKKLDAQYEVIDGQQRLTTLFLLLKFLEQFANMIGSGIPVFELDYETRKGCIEFFKEEKYKEISDANLDFLHISKAYQTIANWFERENKGGKQNDILQVLVDGTYNAQFIWYEIPETENAFDVFKRLNSGKLSLTNSELVKAVILNDEDKDADFNQQDIAREWENIENHLEDDTLWYFINSNPEDEKYKSTRMDYVLEILLKSQNVDLKDNYFIFSKFNERIKDEKENGGWKNVWEDVKAAYRTLQTWCDDRKLYHYIGFLMNTKGGHVVGIEELLNNYAKSDKKDFFESVKNYCRAAIMGNDDNKIDFATLMYGKDNDKIHNILLAFNLATTQNQISETSRYPFKNHFEAAKNLWSLEHIHAQNERQKSWSPEEIKQLQSDIEAIANASVVEEKKKADMLAFAGFINAESLKDEETYRAMMAIFMGEEITLIKNANGDIASVSSDFEKDDTLMNLALLQSDKNAAFNNKTFLEKRRKLAAYENAEQETKFVPICTRNVFFKHYSPDTAKPLVWDREAGKDYVRAIINVVGKFVGAKPFDNFDDKSASEIEYGLTVQS